jgi:ubiquinol-cytochrome c reductase iron-sulfur subunit
MRRLWRAIVALFLLLVGSRKRSRDEEKEQQRIVPDAPAKPGAEIAVAILLVLTALSAAAFVVFFATGSLANQTQLEGAALGGAFVFLSAALIVTSKHLIVTEEIEEEYPEPSSPQEQEEIAQIVDESGDRISRKGLLKATAGAAVAALGTALISPLFSFGPILKTRELQQTPWRRGRRLVDDNGKPYKASDISEEAFYTAYPEGRRKKEEIGGPVVIVRVDPLALKLPPGRADWDAGGIVAYSKICTHAACAVALYRKPLFPAIEPRPALVCPCHYSTFDPAEGAKVIFGPAGRPLPQLPLYVDSRGYLRARGNLSGPPGPAWWGVRSGPARES